jgi:cell division protein FtsB
MAFGCWLIFLSGFLAPFVGSPGIVQAIRLHGLLDAKQDQMQHIEDQIRQLEAEALRLEKSSVVQEREIRRVLGYAAGDEIIFDFGSGRY